ncbi:MAG: arylesterase [Methylococcales bacterium]
MLLLSIQTVSAANILIMGDSISAGYGLELDQGWVALLQKKMTKMGYDYNLVNASISGETSGGGIMRIGREIETHQPVVVIIELGANDGLRGASPKVMESNLSEMIDQASKAGAEVILLGIRIPPNYGKRYTDAFYNVYTRLAKIHKVSFVPFLLDGIGGNKALMQPDGLHPNADAQPKIRDTIWEFLKPVLRKSSKAM